MFLNYAEWPEAAREAIKQLPHDKEFQQRYGFDPVLDALEKERIDKRHLVQDLNAFLNIPLQAGNLKFRQLTLEDWVVLWALDSPFVIDSEKISEADTDLFLATVSFSDVTNYEALVASSLDYCKKLEIDPVIGKQICYTLINLAFSPLKLFPQSGTKMTEGEIPLYDADWVTSVVSKVHAQTGFNHDRIMKNISLNACCAYFVDWAREQGNKGIGRKSNVEVILEMDKRTNYLIVQRFIEKGIIKEEDRDYYEILLRDPKHRPEGFKVRETA